MISRGPFQPLPVWDFVRFYNSTLPHTTGLYMFVHCFLGLPFPTHACIQQASQNHKNWPFYSFSVISCYLSTIHCHTYPQWLALNITSVLQILHKSFNHLMQKYVSIQTISLNYLERICYRAKWNIYVAHKQDNFQGKTFAQVLPTHFSMCIPSHLSAIMQSLWAVHVLIVTSETYRIKVINLKCIRSRTWSILN